MSPTGADRTNQGGLRSTFCSGSSSVTGSLAFNPQNCDPALTTTCVRSFTPRDTLIHWQSPVPGSQRDP